MTKKKYKKPELQMHGNLKETTKGSTPGGAESNNFKASGPE